MKISQLLENTCAGSVATVAQPLGEIQKRVSTSKRKYKNSIETDLNENDRIVSPEKANKYKTGLLAKQDSSNDSTDSIKLNVPLLIRLLEYAREDASNDLDLHDLAEKLVARGSRGKTLTMKDYEFVINEGKQRRRK